MEKSFNRVIAYGCSFTAGDEIMDHVFMDTSFEKCNRIKRQYIIDVGRIDAGAKFRKTYNIQKADAELNRNHSWAACLAKHLDLPFENRAISGSGIDQVYFTIYHDLLRSSISKTDLVLVGLPPQYRMIDFRNPHKPLPLLLAHLDKDNVENKLLIDMFNDDFAHFHYFKTVELLCNLKINIRLQPMLPNMILGASYKIKHTSDYINSVWANSTKNMLLPEESLKHPTVNGEKIMCEFGHPPVESHVLLAEKIYSQVEF
jgi:hypothetical protein